MQASKIPGWEEVAPGISVVEGEAAKALIIEMHRDGYSLKQIGKTTDLRPRTVSNVLKKWKT